MNSIGWSVCRDGKGSFVFQAETKETTMNKARWIGRILSGLTVLFLLFDSAVKLLQLRVALDATVRLGYPASAVFGIGVVEIVVTALYLIPRTSVVGAVLLTGYLGGATASHVRIGDPFFFPIVFGAIAWAGLLLRDRRLLAALLARLTRTDTGSSR
jgi:hypothetical protein